MKKNYYIFDEGERSQSLILKTGYLKNHCFKAEAICGWFKNNPNDSNDYYSVDRARHLTLEEVIKYRLLLG